MTIHNLTLLPKEKYIEAVRLLVKNSGNKKAAAKEAGIPETTFRNRIKTAARRGFMGTDPVLPGFAIARVSTTHDAAGNVLKTHVQQRQEAGEVFEVPEGHMIKGVSALVGADGQTLQKWIKTRDESSVEDVEAALKTVFESYTGKGRKIKAPRSSNKDLLTTYALADHHLGLLAWKPETGANYDLKIASRFLKDTAASLVSQTPEAKTGILLNLGDFLHSDSNENRTRRSQNVLDVEGRYAKVLQIGVELLIEYIELLLTKHDEVEYEGIPGNHDPYATLALNIALAAFFDKNPRVKIGTSPSAFWHRRHGKVLLTATHGDMIKPEQMPGLVAAYWPQDWGETEFRYAYLGHLHNRIKGGGEQFGLVYEVFQTLAAKDAWHYNSGYASGRSMTAITHHKDRGEISRNIVSIPRFVQESV